MSLRWVDVIQGVDVNPNYRSGLVARQNKALDHLGDSCLSLAPPVEALRSLLSLDMTKIGNHRPDWRP